MYPTLQKGYTLVDIEEFKQLIKSKNKQSTDMKQEFKVGDEVIITSWHFNKELPVPQRATIVEINRAMTKTPYGLNITLGQGNYTTVEGNPWWFQEGEFHLATEQKAQEFLIWGKPHHIKAIIEDLKEVGYTLCNSKDHDWLAITN